MDSLYNKHIEKYFRRFASREPLISQPIDRACQMIVVIPCHNEPDLIGTLDSLLDCKVPGAPVEVIIVVNQGELNDSKVSAQNKRTIDAFEEWNELAKTTYYGFHLIQALDMPKKHAGVGLARKVGMDEALRRFASIGIDGSIICLDADCRVSKNYLTEIEEKFGWSTAGLGEVHFEHLYQFEGNEKLRKGIVNYELFLRYYVEGLKYSGFPFAIQTIGSCMLVKASTYAKHGGMNKRKAGEDFYFLHKIIPHEAFIEVKDARVYPSCRTSDRVPFGTGKAQQDWLDQGSAEYTTYDPRIFEELKALLSVIDDFFEKTGQEVINLLPEIPRTFIQSHGYDRKIDLIKTNCKHPEQFRKQFFIWFDGFICMKFIHFVRDNYFKNIPIKQAIASLAIDDQKDIKRLLATLNQ